MRKGCLLALLSACASTLLYIPVTGQVASASLTSGKRVLTAREARALCATSLAIHGVVTVRGYFLPIGTNGPVALMGALFDDPHVPDEAATQWNVARYGGVQVAIGQDAPVLNSAFFRRHDGIPHRSALVVRGALSCHGQRANVTPDALWLPSRSISVTSAGIRLTLTVTPTTYPQDALIPARATVRNVSNHPVVVLGSGDIGPGTSFPQLEVLDAKGTVRYPQALSSFFRSHGPPPRPVMLSPGSTIRTSTYVILRGPRVRATITVLRDGNVGGRRTSVHLSITFTLAESDAPNVWVRTEGGHRIASIQEPYTPPGPLFYVDSASCSGMAYSQHLSWTQTGRLITAGCSPVKSWHIVVGAVDHSVATVDSPPS